MKKIYFLTLLLATGSCLQAQTWTGTTNTNWNTATNWTPNTVPTGTSDVIIPGALVNYPVFANNVTINTIDMQAGSRLDVNGFTLDITNTGVNFNSFTGATINNSNGATDIVFNLNSGGGYPTVVRNNTFNDAVIFNINGIAAFNEADAASQGNHYTGNATFNFGSSGPLNISYLDKSQFDGNLTINHTGSGNTRAFFAGGTVNGNFTYTNNNTGYTYLGTTGAKTSIGGMVNITVNYTTPAPFEMYRFINQTSGGIINVQNSNAGFILQQDTLRVTSLSITGYSGSGSSYFLSNSITGNVTTASDATYTYGTFFSNNLVTGNTSISSNGADGLYEANAANEGNHYIGNTTFTAASSGPLSISRLDKSQFDGNLTINRTGTGSTQAFNAGGAITGNFTFTTNTGSGGIIGTVFGNPGARTTIGGTINITANYTTPDIFQMYRLINQTGGGSINVQNSGAGFTLEQDTLIVNSLSITGYKTGGQSSFSNNSITGNVTTASDAGNTYTTLIRNNTITGNSSFTSNGPGGLLDADASGTGNHYIGNTTFNAASSGQLVISYLDKSQFDGNLTINRTVAGSTQVFNAGGTVTGNFIFTNNAGGGTNTGTSLGNPGIKTTIGGTINITANYATPDHFQMYRLINQTGGGSITVQNSDGGFTLEQDTLIVNSLSITGYRFGGTSSFSNNSITGNVTTASDAGNTYGTFFRNNIITGISSFSINGSGALNDADIASSGNKYIGNVTYISTVGNINVGAGSFTELTQNLTLNSTSGITLGKIKFNGSANSIIEQLGTQPITISAPTIEKTGAGKITLNDPVTVSGILTFNGGNIFSSVGNELVFSDDATYTGLSIASHADGPVTKIGNDVFTFPIGKTTVLTPISISAPAIATDAFRAQYFGQPPNSAGYDITLKDATLNHLSSKEYWLLDRTTGTSNVFVTLSWETARSGVVNSMPDLRVARWNGSLWKDEGNGGTTGTNTSGTVKSLNTVSNFSPFTLASGSLLNPLPLTLINFTASKCNSDICLLWVTENEQNFFHFEIEKSNDSRNFTTLSNIAANNTTGRNTYTSTDINPSTGDNFYRLKMVDIDGAIKYSNIIKVNLTKPQQVSLLPNPASSFILLTGVGNYNAVRIIELSGKVLQQQTIQKSFEEINISRLPVGIYIIQLIGDTAITTIKLVKQ
jgi:Secretion system C-terminal sorting domain